MRLPPLAGSSGPSPARAATRAAWSPWRRLRAAACVAVAALALAACSDGPATPEELFEEGCRVTIEGRHGAFWELMTRDQQKRVMSEWAGMRDTLRRNPGARRMVDRFQVTYEEFLTLPDREIWARAHKGTEPVLVGAKIIDKMVDPVNGQDVGLTFETTAGQQFRWIMRQEPGRGWRLQFQTPVKLEDHK